MEQKEQAEFISKKEVEENSEKYYQAQFEKKNPDFTEDDETKPKGLKKAKTFYDFAYQVEFKDFLYKVKDDLGDRDFSRLRDVFENYA